MPNTSKPCHNCRRRRLRCDRSWPNCHKCAVSGQECLGYGKVFTWTQGIDNNGNPKASSSGRRGASGGVAGGAQVQSGQLPQPQQQQQTLPVRRASVDSSRSEKGEDSESKQAPSPASLTDPIFQDLDRNSRYYLSHCESLPSQRNRITPLSLCRKVFFFFFPSLPPSLPVFAPNPHTQAASLHSCAACCSSV